VCRDLASTQKGQGRAREEQEAGGRGTEFLSYHHHRTPRELMSHADSKSALFGKAAAAPAMPASAAAAKGLTAGIKPKGVTGGLAPKASGMTSEQKLKKIEEARELSERGMKCLKVTVFQWKADHLAAAPLFEGSSNAYKAAGELEQARVMMVQCSKSHDEYGAPGPAALALMNAAKISQAQQNPVQAAAHFQESAEMWGNNGDVTQCAEMTAKAAKELEAVQPDEALSLYKRSLDILAPPDLTTKEQLSKVNINIRDTLRDAFKFTLRGGQARLKDALDIASRMVKQFDAFESEPSMCKSMAAMTIIQLTMRDVVQAEQTYLQEHLGNRHYIASNECKVIDKFILAFKNSDLDMLDDAQKGDNLFYLDAEIQPLARQLSLFSAPRSKAVADSSLSKHLADLVVTAATPIVDAAAGCLAAGQAAPSPPPPPPEEEDLC